jgi:hypothetical protein
VKVVWIDATRIKKKTKKYGTDLGYWDAVYFEREIVSEIVKLLKKVERMNSIGSSKRSLPNSIKWIV